jgi:hypothetical protein
VGCRVLVSPWVWERQGGEFGILTKPMRLYQRSALFVSLRHELSD